MSQLLKVAFRDTNLLVINHHQQPYVPMRPIVDGMGMDWASQFIKLKNNPRSSVVEITMQMKGDDQKRAMTCLPLRKLPGWLISIHPNKVRPEIRDKVIAYQNECDDILWEHWQKWHGKETQLLNNPEQLITIEQQGTIFNLVHNRFHNGHHLAYAWRRFQNYFNINSYKNLPVDRFDEACKYIPTIPPKNASKALPPPIPSTRIKPPIWKKPGAARDIDAVQGIICDLKEWAATELPKETGGQLCDALDDLDKLLVAGWTEVHESLWCISRAVAHLDRWNGKKTKISK